MIIRDIILVVAVLGVMGFGFFIVKRLDCFLDQSKKRTEQEGEKEPLCDVLTTDLSDEELIKRIRAYEEKHGEAKMTLYRDEDDLYDTLFAGKR